MKEISKELKEKLDEISKNAEILSGKDGMIELDPNKPTHKEWFEDESWLLLSTHGTNSVLSRHIKSSGL